MSGRRVAFAFSVWSPKNCTRALKHPQLFSQRQLGAASSRTHLQGPAAPSSPAPVLRAGPRSRGPHTVSPRATLAPAGVTRPLGSPEITPRSELRFPEPRSGGAPRTPASPGCALEQKLEGARLHWCRLGGTAPNAG